MEKGRISSMSKMLRSIGHNVIANWISGLVLLVLWAVAVWLASLTPLIRLYAPFSYFMVALIAELVLSMMAFFAGKAWRIFNPAPTLPTSPTLDHPTDAEFAHLRVRVAALEDRIKSIIEDYQRMLALDGRFEEARTYIYNEIAVLHAHRSLDADRFSLHFAAIRTSLRAVFDRERLGRRAHELQLGATELAAPTHAKVKLDQDQWQEWEAKEAAWQAALREWCSWASAYVPTISEQVLVASDEHYRRKGEAKEDQFPDAEAYFAYKTFCALWKHFKDCQEEVFGAVHGVAFEGHAIEGGAMLPSYRKEQDNGLAG